MRALPLALSLLGILAISCAKKENAEPPDVPFEVKFPSTAAALATDTVKVYVFDGALVCDDLIRLRQTAQPLPSTVAETPTLTPCQLHKGENNSFDLTLERDYTMLAVGQIGGQDVFIGCAVQTAYGTTLANPIQVSFIDDRVNIPAQTCTRLSDKCNGTCR
jgi:hypothetical protein